MSAEYTAEQNKKEMNRMGIVTPTVLVEEQRISQPQKPRRRKRRGVIRKIVWIFVIILIVVCVLLYVRKALQTEYTVTYQQYNATTGTISNSLSFSGTLSAVNSQTCLSNNSGTVKQIYVSPGDQVQIGDKLIRLSTGQILKAEIDGEINEMKASEGDEISAGTTLCDVVDFTHLKTSIRVDEYDINSVHIGDPIKITTVATDKSFDSKIASINHTSSSAGAVAYYTTTAYVDVGEDVYPGMQVTVTLPQEEAVDVVILKEDAISFDDENKAFVYTAGESGEMERTYISTGVSNGSYVEITSGLQAGDTVYAEAKVTAENSAGGILSGLFGNTQIMGGGPDMGGMQMPDMGAGRNQDAGNRPGGNGEGRPSSGGFGGGNR